MDTEKLTDIANGTIETVKTVEEIALGYCGYKIVKSFCPEGANIFVKAAFALAGWCIGDIFGRLNSKRVDDFVLKMLQTMVPDEDATEVEA